MTCDKEDIHDMEGIPTNNRIRTDGKSWAVVYSSYDVFEDDLVFCWMKCGSYRAGRAKDQDWILVKEFVVVERG